MSSSDLPKVGEVYGYGDTARTVLSVGFPNRWGRCRVAWKRASGATGSCYHENLRAWASKQERLRREAQPDPKDQKIADLMLQIIDAYREGFDTGVKQARSVKEPDGGEAWGQSSANRDLKAMTGGGGCDE